MPRPQLTLSIEDVLPVRPTSPVGPGGPGGPTSPFRPGKPGVPVTQSRRYSTQYQSRYLDTRVSYSREEKKVEKGNK